MVKYASVALVVTLALTSAAPLASQTNAPVEGWVPGVGELDIQPQAFGPGLQYTVFHASDMSGWFGTTRAGYVSGTGYIFPLDNVFGWWGQVQLPQGAYVESVCFFVYDANPDFNWSFVDFHGYKLAEAGEFPDYTSFGGIGSPGSGVDDYSAPCVSPGITIRSRSDFGSGPEQFVSYNVSIEKSNAVTDSSLRFGGYVVVWRRQVSPAPALATFNDVPTTHPFFPFVEALVDSGITAGCGGGNYCPDDPLTRGQMAVFLAAGLGLHWPL